jgi:hypothetical protein
MDHMRGRSHAHSATRAFVLRLTARRFSLVEATRPRRGSAVIGFEKQTARRKEKIDIYWGF